MPETNDKITAPAVAYMAMEDRWQLITDLLGGTLAMRENAHRWLPQEPKEHDVVYRNRVSRTVLFEAFGQTVRVLRSTPFKKPVHLSEDTDERIKELEDNVDLGGTSLGAFAEDCLDDCLGYGLAHILTDFPDLAGLQEQRGVPFTLADETSMGLRAYLVRIPPPNLFSWAGGRRGGGESLDEIRFFDSRLERKGDFGQEVVRLVRVYRPNLWQVWAESDKDEWVLESEGVNTLGKVPLTTVYVNREGLLVADPPLEALAWLNLRHWQSQSDQDNILHIVRVPQLFGAGFAEGTLTGASIGPNSVLSSPDPTAKLSYIEHSGKGIEAGLNDLKDLRERMRIVGARMLVQMPGNQTATAKAIDTASSDSELQAIVRRLEQGLEKALALAAEWQGWGDDVNIDVQIDQDFGLAINETSDLEVLKAARQNLDIDQGTFLEEIQRRGVLAPGRDLEDVMEKTQEEEANAPQPLPFPAPVPPPAEEEEEEEG